MENGARLVMFTCYVGSVGSGKTYTMVRAGMLAYERGETVFSNIALDVSGWDNRKGGKFVMWHKPKDLLEPHIHCGVVLWDELGAFVNNREYDSWPIELTIKIIEHRKDHLDFYATIQNDEMADKNVRRFYNTINFVHEHRWPLVGTFWPDSCRPDLRCNFPDCRKNHQLLTRGDRKIGFLRFGTFYLLKDIHPEDTQNKFKHRSKGLRAFLFDKKVALAYNSGYKVASEAVQGHEEMKRDMFRKKGFFRRRF